MVSREGDKQICRCILFRNAFNPSPRLSKLASRPLCERMSHPAVPGVRPSWPWTVPGPRPSGGGIRACPSPSPPLAPGDKSITSHRIGSHSLSSASSIMNHSWHPTWPLPASARLVSFSLSSLSLLRRRRWARVGAFSFYVPFIQSS